MKWKNVLDNWYSGNNLPNYSKKIKNPYLWKTTYINKDESSLFKQENFLKIMTRYGLVLMVWQFHIYM